MEVLDGALSLIYPAPEGEAAPPVIAAQDRVEPAPEVKAEIVEARPLLRLGAKKPPKGERHVPAVTQAIIDGPTKKGRPRGPLYDAIRAVLLEAGKFLTVREVAMGIEKRHKDIAKSLSDLRGAVRTALARMERDGDVIGSCNDNGIDTYGIEGAAP